jgi:hypothetical protein
VESATLSALSSTWAVPTIVGKPPVVPKITSLFHHLLHVVGINQQASKLCSTHWDIKSLLEIILLLPTEDMHNSLLQQLIAMQKSMAF